jgi:hypothetical protein
MKQSRLLIALLTLSIGFSSQAKDFPLPTLPHADEPTYDIADHTGQTYYDFVHKTLAPAMQAIAPDPSAWPNNEEDLKDGKGISVKLGENNYNVHINFPNGPRGGRSYGWTSGQIGDWSDAMYLDNLAEVVDHADEKEIANFYKTIIQILGKSDARGIEKLDRQSQRTANNFLAIYTAEQYRAIVPDGHENWDDALFQTTLLGAFHGGQETLKMFYVGEFTSTTRKQGSGVYFRGKPGELFEEAKEKEAELRDYWQFSHKVDSKQSGINITRADFEKLGKAITRLQKGNRTMARIEAVVGKSNNIFKAISTHYTEGHATVEETDQLAKDIAQFMLDIYNDAEEMTKKLSE